MLAAGALWFGAGSAFATEYYPYDSTLAPTSGSFANLTTNSVAVDDANGDTYVADSGLGVVDVFDSSGAQIGTWDGSAAANPPGTPAGSFGGGLLDVAADNSSGDVYVLDPKDDVVDELSSSGAYVCQITGSVTPSASECNGAAGSATPAGGFSFPDGIAVDQATGDVYVLDSGNGVVDVFSSAGAYLSQVALSQVPGGVASTIGLAVSGFNGHLFVGDTGQVHEFDSSGNYVTSWTGGACQPGSSGSSCATPAGSFGTQPSVAVDDATGTVFISDQKHTTDVFDASGNYLAQFSHSYVDPTGTAVDQANGKVYVADNGTFMVGGSGVVDVFGPSVTVPDVSTGQASAITSSGATLSGTVNPDGIEVTGCEFEYGTTSAYGQTAPCAQSPGSGSSPVSVSAQTSGLAVGGVYHYRLTATNANGPSDGADQSFRVTAAEPPRPTFGACPNDSLRYGYGAYLPDCRAYEQASPVDKGGSDITGDLFSMQAAEDGNGVAFEIPLGLPGIPGATDELAVYEANRGASDWSTVNLLPPASSQWRGDRPTSGVGLAGWSPDLSRSLAWAQEVSPSQQHAVVLSDPETGSYQVIATGADPPRPDGWSSDDSRVVFEAMYSPLVPGAAAGQDNVYEWDQASSKLVLVGVLPDGSTPSSGSFAGPYNNQGPTGGGAENAMYTQSAVSSDGSRVVFTAEPNTGRDASVDQVYQRENATGADASTVQVSASAKTNGSGPGGTDPNGPQAALFQAATPDGSQVFFTSPEELTNDATTGSADQGNDLYDYDANTGVLSDLTPDTSDADGADVQGVVGASDDGSYVYFVADGTLAAGATPGDCGLQFAGVFGVCNLYVWHDGTISFIAQLNMLGLQQAGDYSDITLSGASSGATLKKTSRVTPDGRTLLFSTADQLTGYDNDGATELYRYSAPTGQLICVSCDPSGAAPVGGATLNDLEPQAISTTTSPPFLTRNLSDDGERVFFESPDPLVSGDVNGSTGCALSAATYPGSPSCQDVYEWEADGAGSCQSSSENGGCLYLISTGTSADPSYFLDASASGNDVFFFTDQPLVGQDTDQLVDVYDARVDGGLAAQNPGSTTPCVADGCKPPPTVSPPPPTVGTVSFYGPGDSTPERPARVRVSRSSVRAKVFAVRASVPQAGTIRVSGAGVDAVTRSVTRAGRYRLVVHLSARARRKLRHKGTLRVWLRITYEPAGGSASLTRMSILVRGR